MSFSALGPAPLCGGICQPGPKSLPSKTHTPKCLWRCNIYGWASSNPHLLNLPLQRFPVPLYSSRTGHRPVFLSWNTNSQCLWRSVFHSVLGCEQGRLKSQSLLLLPGCGDSTGSGMRDSGINCRGVNSQLFHMGSVNVCVKQDFLMENKSLLFDGQIFI